MHDLDTSVVAVATPPGRGGVACVRISGTDAGRIAARLFKSNGQAAEQGKKPCFGTFLDRDQTSLDHGYLVLFAAAHAFTGENTAELWPHGSPAVLQELVAGAIEAGAVPAGPGEFTYRALRNGRLDLSRSEAIRDLIQARTRYQARLAFEQAEGSLSRRIAPLREQLEEWIARGEAAVEFVEESETHLPSGSLAQGIRAAAGSCDELLEGYRTGRVVRDGARLVLIGRPNVGKSSLFNRLLREDRAIVTEIAGTTRDTLEEELVLDGIPVRLIDTAGLREVRDAIEVEGVSRARRALEEADLVLLVLDGSREPDELERETLARAEREGARWVAVANKCDLRQVVDLEGTASVSATSGEGIDPLRSLLRSRLTGSTMLEHPVVTNGRHAAALEQARATLGKALEALEGGLSEEWVLEDLKRARRELATVTGEFGVEDLYDKVFSTFCIGK